MKTTKLCPVQKNEKYVVTIEDLTYEGFGVAKVEGYPIFIENALPGEEVETLVLKVGKQFAFGKVLQFLEKSEHRVDDENMQWIRTGIAPLHHLAYPEQLKFKQSQVENVFTRIAKMPEVSVLPTIGMEEPRAYRNKAQIPVRSLEGKLETGFFRKNSHDLVPLEDYYIQDKEIDRAITVVREIMRKFQVKAYNEQENTGNLRHIIVRRGHYTHQMMIVLVTRTPKLFQHEKMVKEIVAFLPEVTSIIQNIHPERTNVILGKEEKVLYGEPYITDTLFGKVYHISAQSFYQVNTSQTEKLYQTAIEFAKLTPEDVVIDAYCGIGTIGLSLAEKVKQVYGVEMAKSAIRDAKLNAMANEIENISFETGKAEYVMKKWQEEAISVDVVFVDPPRKGLDPHFIEATVEMKPKKLIYISCNPATLARDAKILAEKGYKIEKVQPVDMFPQTAHVETIVLLQRI